ncbi:MULTISPECIES: sigma-70 family RNA polymerase sigma factor [Paenibacillus]|uniref:sigma-70 family RNA polymerase sigma factor n=1 Tax=Paenibacillus TaxID=44249 RepID=UPI0008386340|nr:MULTISPECIES: sigma-70 family RNA polymerase sigma factor [Paenibacillus]
MNTDQESEVRRAQAGSQASFINLIKQYEVQMYNVARSIVKKDEDCADAMQETVLKAYRSLINLENPAFFKTWLFRILINECNLILRGRSKVLSLHKEEGSYHNTSVNAERMDLRDAVYRLEEVSRTIVILHYFRDLPLRQVAELMDMTEAAVKTRLHRARHTLAEWLVDSAERRVNI